MRRLLLPALAALSLSAQDPQAPAPAPRPPMPHARRGGDLQALGLTDEQRQKAREIRGQYPNDPKARRKALMGILTPEQREKLKEIRRHRRELRRAPEPGD